jgi:hypothetical protein
MFTTRSDQLVAFLDEMLGSRRATQQLLALASAAVLTAFPYDHKDQWLDELRMRIADTGACAPPPVKAHSGVTADQRDAALQLLLAALDRDHAGDREAILEKLGAASALALAGTPSALNEWNHLLGASHATFRTSWLAKNTDLN